MNPHVLAPEDQPHIVSIEAIVDCLGVTKARIGQLVASGVVVKLGRNQYDLGASIRGYTQTLEKRAGNAATNELLEAAKMAKVEIETKRQKLAYDQECGVLIDVARVRESGVRMGALLSATLRSKPSAWAPLLAGKSEDEIREILEREIGVMIKMLISEFEKSTRPRCR
ncbi:MAG: hypothetical protein WCO60_02500 [Verrucomicrobiota bacterium]